MINSTTVFILGAGASEPYGLPTASKLKSHICDAVSVDANLVDVEEKTGTPPQALKSMVDDLKGSGLHSVDLWLEKRKGDYGEIGKVCIAREIIGREDSQKLPDGWYSDLWNSYLIPPGGEGPSMIADNKVSFITFNYDRSLEQALMMMVTKTYRINESEVAEILNKIPIIHVYGQVGRLPWQPKTISPIERSYSNTWDWREAKEAATGIKILHESDSETLEFQRAHEFLAKAERIYFLGFGYHGENMRRLQSPKSDQKIKQSYHIAGSALGLPWRERNPLEQGHNPLGVQIRLGIPKGNVNHFIQSLVPRI